MARYFFDILDGDHVVGDEHGMVCATDAHAIKCARRALATYLADADGVRAWDHMAMTVRCEDGTHIARLGMTVEVETQNPVMQAVARVKTLRIDGG